MKSNRGVRGGTAFGEALCRSCRHATYVQGLAESQRLLFCDEIYEIKGPMPFEAMECSKYDDKRLPSKPDLYQIAWQLRTDPKQKGTLGFFSPTQLREMKESKQIPFEDDRGREGPK